jgi:hypothetical protein
VRPLASADFDEDGVQDLVGSYSGEGAGITLHRGNIDSIYPDAEAAAERKLDGALSDSPLLSPALKAEICEAADFVGAGDFDEAMYEVMKTVNI